MTDYPKTIEEFIEQYEGFVRLWFNANNKMLLDFNEFWSTFLIKLYEKKTLEKYNPDHPTEAKDLFKAWLRRVLNHHYIDLGRKEMPPSKRLSIDDMYERELGPNQKVELELSYEQEYVPTDDLNKIFELVEQIPNVIHRIITKLKYFDPDYFSFSEEEIHVMSRRSTMNDEDILDFIYKNRKEILGLKNSDISTLTGLAEDSISATHDRTVKKWIIEPYRRWEAGLE